MPFPYSEPISTRELRLNICLLKSLGNSDRLQVLLLSHICVAVCWRLKHNVILNCVESVKNNNISDGTFCWLFNGHCTGTVFEIMLWAS